ncbi:MAG TPA: aminodeoxychorismate/anthranilate synthase component II [Myxococcales bacterium]|nr:aminodeoxychorismate/anthranilate synthase component II [Myxococcales bacterium]HIK86198.1 aminodeoxychorismate/anthranilate synthase component II [Myxococcales bacterium]
MIDNYDSFTYNLVQYLGELGAEVDVVRNDDADADTLLSRAGEGLVISPGPGTPADAGVSVEAIQKFGAAGIPVFGVCLGLQSIGVAFGGEVIRAQSIMHGKVSTVEHDGRGVFRGLPTRFEATRYHSLVLEESSLPDVLEITARTDDGEIMGVRHRSLAIEGVQFHPESIMTGEGKALLGNFLSHCREGRRNPSGSGASNE